jgi:putative peptidoglycan lipid II flippase
VVGKEVPVPDEDLSGDQTGPLSADRPDGDTAEGLVRSTAAMAVGTTLSRITGFLRVAAMAFALGVAESRLADAYNVANNIPNIVYELILGGILTSVFVPVFVHQMAKRSRAEAWRSAQAVMTVTFLVLLVVTVVGIVTAPWIIQLYTLRVPDAARPAVQELGTLFLRFFMPQILLYGLGAVATGLLNAHRRFAVPMFAPILNNLVVIGTFVAFAFLVDGQPTPTSITTGQKLLLALGTTAGVAAMTVALWPSLRAVGFRWRWVAEPRNEAVRSLIRLSGWAVLYVVINQVGLLVVIVLAGAQQGAYAAYTIAFIFFQLPHAIFSVSIMTALLPSLAEDWVRRDPADFRRDLVRGIRASAFVVIPAAAGYLVLAEPIVRLLIQHGVATAASTELVAGVLRFFSLGLFQFSAFMLCLRAFYAMHDTRTPALINAAAVAVNVAANVILFPFLEVRGLALGHAAAYTFAAVVALTILRRRLGGLGGRDLTRGMVRILAAAVLTAAAAWGAARLVAETLGVVTTVDQIVQVGAGMLAGLVAFVAAATLFRMEEFELVKRTVRSRLRR